MNHSKYFHWALRFTLATLFAATLTVRPAAAGYSITDLGTIPGGESGQALGINNLGQVVGTFFKPGGADAFLYSGGTLSDLGALPGFPYALAGSINDGGQAVGFSLAYLNPDAPAHSFLWSSGSGLQDLNLPGSPYGIFSDAHALNDAGQIVGEFKPTAADPFHAFVATGSTVTDLQPLFPAGTQQSEALAIDGSGQVAGKFVDAVGNFHAFRESSGVAQDLGTLGGAWAYGLGINDLGDVVGFSTLGSGQLHAFLWDGTTMHDIDKLGSNRSQALSINRSGQVVGDFDAPGGGGAHAFLYDSTSNTMTDLNNLLPAGSGWSTLTNAWSINNAGQIVGWGDLDGERRAYLLSPDMAPPVPISPVPEPGSLAVLALCGLPLLGRLRCHRETAR